jgi:Ca2+-binding EF-hand superfamily protein
MGPVTEAHHQKTNPRKERIFRALQLIDKNHTLIIKKLLKT